MTGIRQAPVAGQGMRLLITGGAGFIGSHFARLALERWRQAEIVVLDLLTYASSRETLVDILPDSRVTFMQGDICSEEDVRRAMEGCSHVVHFAAETHVDRALLDPLPFYRTNVEGTRVVLEEARRRPGLERLLHVSTDEVYGDMPAPDRASEERPPSPRNPYAVSKATADSHVLGYAATFGVPGLVSRGTNTYGPFQHPEKLLPLTITQALGEVPIPLYGDGLQLRDWLHVHDHCTALALLLEAGSPGEIYNVGAGNGRTNLAMVEAILDLLGADRSLIRHVRDREAHDRRYAVNTDKVRRLGWQPRVTLEHGLSDTVRWYRANRTWQESVTGSAHEAYYQRQYGARLATE
jgi:dTDP-glucose 4,6-dehydratase